MRHATIASYETYTGFLVGKEGPMIHSGAIVGAGFSQFRSLLFKSVDFPYPYFRSDRYICV